MEEGLSQGEILYGVFQIQASHFIGGPPILSLLVCVLQEGASIFLPGKQKSGCQVLKARLVLGREQELPIHNTGFRPLPCFQNNTFFRSHSGKDQGFPRTCYIYCSISLEGKLPIIGRQGAQLGRKVEETWVFQLFPLQTSNQSHSSLLCTPYY